MDESRPSLENGVLRLPGQEGVYADLTLSNHYGNLDSSIFDFELTITNAISVRGRAAHLERCYPLANVWSSIRADTCEKAEWTEVRSESASFAVQVSHDGLGHYFARITVLPVGYVPETRVVATVLVEAGRLPLVAQLWSQFFLNPVPPR